MAVLSRVPDKRSLEFLRVHRMKSWWTNRMYSSHPALPLLEHALVP